MTEQITNKHGSDSTNVLASLTWSEQIEYIMELEYDHDDHTLIEDLKKTYEHINKRLYGIDLNRYRHLYLAHVCMNQALYLYDSMSNDARCNLIAAILKDHPHLMEMIQIHETLVPTCIESVYTTTIQ